MGNKKVQNVVVVAGVILVFVLYESGVFSSRDVKPQSKPSSSNPAAQNTPAQTSAKAQVGNKPMYALQVANNSWPPTDDSDSVANNLLAQNFYIILDGSGSMQGSECSNGQTKLKTAKQALGQFVEQISTQANIGLLAFDKKGVQELKPLGKHGRTALQGSINQVHAGGGTPLSVAIEHGYKALTKQASLQLGYGEYHLVVVTDGEANTGYEPNKAVQSVLTESPVVIHTIGFCIRGSHSLNQQGLTLYKAANDPKALAQGLSNVLAELPDFNVQNFEG